eukprot:c21027_g1_i1 orf=409-1881(-)
MAMVSERGPYRVPMALHLHNRNKLLLALRDRLEVEKRPVCGFVFLQGGEEQTRYCTDHFILFRQESYFAYLFGVREPGFFGALDVATGRAILFMPRLEPDYEIWCGRIEPPSHFKEVYGVDLVHYIDEIADILKQQSGEEMNRMLYLLHGLNTDSNKYSKPAHFQGIESFEVDLEILHPVLTECRVVKSHFEVELLRYANKISSAAHVEVMQAAKSGMTEYQLESIFLHHVYFHGGCRHVSYTCICATGENGAILHYGHAAAPNNRSIEDGDMALLDMGAEYHFYGSDITCSFPVNGKFTADQCVVYGAVLLAQKSVIQAIKPGVNWVDMHKLAESKILESLKDGGLLEGNVNEMMGKRLGAVFMPHGLGHFLGLDTHDPGGYTKGMERYTDSGLRSLRTTRVLQEGMVITVEPGCYFIDSLLVSAMDKPETSKFFNKQVIERFKGSGGVRLEDNIVVTADGCENLTNCPREIWEVQAVMNGTPWPIPLL